MQFSIIKKNNIQPNIWDGGKTYQYYIYPQQSNYQTKDFQFRISVASIEKKPSDFTKFHGFNRYLIMLNSELEIIRNNKKEQYLQQQLFSFDSDDTIQSYTLGMDFNLMISKKINKQQIEISNLLQTNHEQIFVFGLEKSTVSINFKKITLGLDELLCIDNNNKDYTSITTNKNAILIAISEF